MAKETIDSIKGAELKAQQILKDAESQKKAILEEAREKAGSYEKQLLAQAKSRAEAAVGQVLAGQDEKIASAVKEAEALKAQHQEGMAAKRAEAIRLVIAEIA